MMGELLIGGGFAVVVAGFLIKFLTDLVKNHLHHNTLMLAELRDAIKELTVEIRSNRMPD